MAEGAVYVYGVLPASERAASDVVGVGGSKVRRVEEASLAAVISDLPGDSLNAPREVRNHWRVLEGIGEDATVLPARFGTVKSYGDVFLMMWTVSCGANRWISARHCR